MKEFSMNLKKIRKLHGMSQNDLAIAMQRNNVDVHKNRISDLELNKSSAKDYEIVCISSIFKVEPNDLLIIK